MLGILQRCSKHVLHVQQVLETKLCNTAKFDKLSVCSCAHALTGQISKADIIEHRLKGVEVAQLHNALHVNAAQGGPIDSATARTKSESGITRSRIIADKRLAHHITLGIRQKIGRARSPTWHVEQVVALRQRFSARKTAATITMIFNQCNALFEINTKSLRCENLEATSSILIAGAAGGTRGSSDSVEERSARPRGANSKENSVYYSKTSQRLQWKSGSKKKNWVVRFVRLLD
jgi:hypothetical protein